MKRYYYMLSVKLDTWTYIDFINRMEEEGKTKSEMLRKMITEYLNRKT